VRFLPEAIASLRDDAAPPVEILVADNASAEPIPTLPDIRVQRWDTRLSIGAIRNRALEAVRTEYVMWWDADDIALPGMLRHVHDVSLQNPDAVAITCSRVSWNPATGRETLWPFPRDWAYRIARSPRLLAAVGLLVNPFPTTGATLINVAAFRDLGGFLEDVPYGEDWAPTIGLALRGRVVLTRRPGRRYRVHEESLTAGESARPTRYREVPRRTRQRVRADPRTPFWLRACLPAAAGYAWYKHWYVSRHYQGGWYGSLLDGRAEPREGRHSAGLPDDVDKGRSD
jgi:glycosyltransferase involved in cell wall biosynthesis